MLLNSTNYVCSEATEQLVRPVGMFVSSECIRSDLGVKRVL